MPEVSKKARVRLLTPTGRGREMALDCADHSVNFHKAHKVRIDGMKHCAKICKEAAALPQVIPGLSPHSVHDEISNFHGRRGG